jgi:hypothetical protein
MTLKRKTTKKITKKIKKQNPDEEVVITFKDYQKTLQASLGKEVTVYSHGSRKSPATDIRVTGKLDQGNDGKHTYYVIDNKSRAYFESYDIAEISRMFDRLYISI